VDAGDRPAIGNLPEQLRALNVVPVVDQAGAAKRG
jgi:hypothetical protein